MCLKPYPRDPKGALLWNLHLGDLVAPKRPQSRRQRPALRLELFVRRLGDRPQGVAARMAVQSIPMPAWVVRPATTARFVFDCASMILEAELSLLLAQQDGRYQPVWRATIFAGALFCQI